MEKVDSACKTCVKKNSEVQVSSSTFLPTGMPSSLVSHWITSQDVSFQPVIPPGVSLRSHYVKLLRPGDVLMSDIISEMKALLEEQRKMNEKNCKQS